MTSGEPDRAADDRDEAGLWLVDLAPTSRQDRLAIAATAVTLIGFAAAAPFAQRPLAELNALFPSLDAIVLVTDLTTAVLLFVQFSLGRSRALLAIAIGYLFNALIVVPHALTFRGAFSETGLFGAGMQTGSYLFIFWHLGFALALLVYAFLRRSRQATPMSADQTQPAIIAATVGIIALVVFLTWLSTAGVWLLPPIISDQNRISRLVVLPIMATMLILAVANVVLSTRRRSVLDQWLMVVALASILELVFSGLIPSVRFSLGFYAGRILSIITSSVVLIVLLAETTWLYMQLAKSNAMLRRERENRLMNMDALMASIEHEVRQPLGALTINGESAVLLLDKMPADLAEAKSAVTDMIADGHRINETFGNIRALFGAAPPVRERVDINGLVLEVLQSAKADCARHGIESTAVLAPEQPVVMGHRGQLRELLGNLVQNAIEAMSAVEGPRTLTLRTSSAGMGVTVSVEDSGPGIAADVNIFDAFVTTKSNGRGLGLAICRMIVERHGGHLSVLPASPRGSIFQTRLPS